MKVDGGFFFPSKARI